jgi:GGDEF domain-containing protein
MASRLSTLGYNRARNLILAVGLIVLLLVAALMYVRRVEAVEVAGTLLFIPIFLAFAFAGLRGGLIAGVLATVAYAALRYPAIDLVGFGRFASLTASRAVAFIAFGTIGGIANAQLGASLTKLDLFDQIDDSTGLFNARFFVDNTGLEMERSGRYQTIFCVVVVDVPGEVLGGMNKRNRDRAVKELGRLVKEGIRTVDRGVHAVDGERHRFATILPETGRDGGRVFAGRLVEKMVETLSHRGATDPQRVKFDVATFPGDEEDLQEFRRDFASLEALEHPESAHTA